MKKLNRKGFTLIELLAVIVILAVLMLLATPSVLGIMNNARKNAVATEAMSIINAAKTKYAADAMGTVNENTDNVCYGLKSLATYIDKEFDDDAKAVVLISGTESGSATYTVAYYNGVYSVNGSGSISGESVIEGATEKDGKGYKIPDACKTISVADQSWKQ